VLIDMAVAVADGAAGQRGAVAVSVIGVDRIRPDAFAINTAWLAVVTLAVDLITWTQHLLLHGDLAKAEPKTLRYQLLHVAARLTRGQRRLWLRIQRTWPWARDLAAAFARLRTPEEDQPARSQDRPAAR
jgi:hypothetical protein